MLSVNGAPVWNAPREIELALDILKHICGRRFDARLANQLQQAPQLACAIVRVLGGDSPPIGFVGHEQGERDDTCALFHLPTAQVELKELSDIAGVLASAMLPDIAVELLAAGATGECHDLQTRLAWLIDCATLMHHEDVKIRCSSFCGLAGSLHMALMPDDLIRIETTHPVPHSTLPSSTEAGSLASLTQSLADALRDALRSRNSSYITNVLSIIDQLPGRNARAVVEDGRNTLHAMRMSEEAEICMEQLQDSGLEVELEIFSEAGSAEKALKKETSFVAEKHTNMLIAYAGKLVDMPRFERWTIFAIARFLQKTDSLSLKDEITLRKICRKALKDCLKHDHAGTQGYVRDFRADIAARLCASLDARVDSLMAQGRLIQLESIAKWCVLALMDIAGEFEEEKVKEILKKLKGVKLAEMNQRELADSDSEEGPDPELSALDPTASNYALQVIVRPFLIECRDEVCSDIAGITPCTTLFEPLFDMVIALQLGPDKDMFWICRELAANKSASRELRLKAFRHAMRFMAPDRITVETQELYKALMTMRGEQFSALARIAFELDRGTFGAYWFQILCKHMPDAARRLLQEFTDFSHQLDESQSASEIANAFVSTIHLAELAHMPFIQWRLGQCIGTLLKEDQSPAHLIQAVILRRRKGFAQIIFEATDQGQMTLLKSLLAAVLRCKETLRPTAPASFANFTAEILMQMARSAAGARIVIRTGIEMMRSRSLTLAFIATAIAVVGMKVERNQEVSDYLLSNLKEPYFKFIRSLDGSRAIELAGHFIEAAFPDLSPSAIQWHLSPLVACLDLEGLRERV